MISLQLRGRDRAPNETTPSREATGVASLDGKAMEARLKTVVERVCEGLLPGSPFRERRPGTEKGVLLPIRARPGSVRRARVVWSLTVRPACRARCDSGTSPSGQGARDASKLLRVLAAPRVRCSASKPLREPAAERTSLFGWSTAPRRSAPRPRSSARRSADEQLRQIAAS